MVAEPYQMNCRSHIIVVLFIGLLMSLTSCVTDSDFSSTDNKLPTQKIDSNLIVTTLEASNFVETDERKEVVVLTDTMLLEGMSSEFYLGQLIKTQLSFKFINTLDRDFKVDFEFLNDEDVLVHNVQVPVSAGSMDAPIEVEATVTIKEPELIAFKEASKLVYKITLPASKKQLNFDTKGKMSLQSKATFFFDI